MHDDDQTQHPITKQWGWEDANGNIWVPTGAQTDDHGGAHWDVVYPDGIKHHNVYPAANKITKPAPETKTIICSLPVFYTDLDERFFFEWIQKIACIIKIQGKGRELYLSIDVQLICDQDLRHLEGLFMRYKLENSDQIACL